MSTIPPARTRPFWTDLRFLLGVVLVVVSIVGVWLVVASARQTAPVFAAARTIVGGQELTADDVRVVEVALGALDGTYAAPGALEPGSIATQTIRAGELVPVAAVGPGDQARTTTIVVRSSTPVPESVEAGTTIEVWAAPQTERGVFDDPRIIVPRATVVAVRQDDGVMAGTQSTLEVVVDRTDVAAALSAIAAGDALSVVPAVGR